MNVQEKQLTVNNRKGVHGRIATKLIKIATRYDVRMCIVYNDEMFECSSVLDILAIALVYGATFRIRVEGINAGKALAAIEQFITSGNEF